MTDKINFETFLDETQWSSSDKKYWQEFFKGTHPWPGEGEHWMFEEKYSEIKKRVNHLKYVPYIKDGELHLSEALTLQKYMKRLRYVMRGNTIPNYGLKFEEGRMGWNTVEIDGRTFERIFDHKSNKLKEVVIDKQEEVVTMGE
jgi:hypothetical protein